ncbi:hypothetical protein F4821DRAFT_263469 [Hypoxylon rubiginosum]|uniref:Uncharacterized protein n=1 Tax=Hypoxylon rubiginosum TaxID=110542 RepID=A0ACC0CR78_9PEZI|nr:hypothetical protein F4821DRAFT_263469 [Hypoxylon rubiginosum]
MDSILDLTRTIITFLDLALHHPDVINSDHLNPARLAIGTHGYNVQAHVLHIPDYIGFFSPSPPRLQTRQGSKFLEIIVQHTMVTLFLYAPVLLFLRCWGRRHVARWARMFVGQIVFAVLADWVWACCDKRRDPGYVWGDWEAL